MTSPRMWFGFHVNMICQYQLKMAHPYWLDYSSRHVSYSDKAGIRAYLLWLLFSDVGAGVPPVDGNVDGLCVDLRKIGRYVVTDMGRGVLFRGFGFTCDLLSKRGE